MELAVLEAKKGYGFVSPNPPVGCVILDKQTYFLSSGFHKCYGAVHAEISALNKVQDKSKLKGAHLFVTLEPCAHFGKTPPCVDHLLKLPLASITYGLEDPNPQTKKAKGLQKLKSKGMRVQKSSFLQNEIRRMYEAFALNMEKNLAFFALKTASSIDGVMSMNHGESQWITGIESRDFVFELRAMFDAVLIGVGTFLEDNPRLNCRLKGFEKIKNKVCILDPSGRSLKLIPNSLLARSRPLENIFVITSPAVPKKNYPFKMLSASFNSHTHQIDLQQLSRLLFQNKIGSVLVEGGAKTFSSFVEQNIAHRLYHFINPCLLGGKNAKYWSETCSTPSLKEKKQLSSTEILYFGQDICMTGVL